MQSKQFKTLVSLSLLLFFASLSFAQDSIPPVATDTTEIFIDSTKIDTIVIRSIQDKIRNIRRGANLTNPVVSFKQTKPLSQKLNRFRIPSFWVRENKLTVNLNEVAFVDWKAGGNNSFSAIGRLNFVRNYKFRYVQWDNDLELKYGMNAQEGRKLRKTDDAIRFNSTFGYRKDTLTSWYYSVKATFNTQFSDGFTYPNRENPISRFMSPGYVFLGAGTSYIPEGKKFNLYLSPFTFKSTYVLDQDLANQGAFGVDAAEFDEDGNMIKEGSNHYSELGILITNTWETTLGKNVTLNNKINLYTDYLYSFGNIDIDWELNLNLKVNQYIQANIGTHMIYDDDIKFDEVKDTNGDIIDPGEPRIQLKQILGVGVNYNF